MFSTVDKALVALIMAIVFLLNHYFMFNIGIDQAHLEVFVTLITPLLVYLIPNKKKEG